LAEDASQFWKNRDRAEMKAIGNRIRKLEVRLFPDIGQPQRLWVTVLWGREFALDQDRCIEILGECGFLPNTRFGLVNLCGIPDGLTARELEKYLRTNGTQAPGFGGVQKHVGQGGAFQLGDNNWSNHAQMSENVLR
jgi:hypothetical protein